VESARVHFRIGTGNYQRLAARGREEWEEEWEQDDWQTSGEFQLHGEPRKKIVVDGFCPRTDMKGQAESPLANNGGNILSSMLPPCQ
jgi:hypothetical protein